MLAYTQSPNVSQSSCSPLYVTSNYKKTAIWTTSSNTHATIRTKNMNDCLHIRLIQFCSIVCDQNKTCAVHVLDDQDTFKLLCASLEFEGLSRAERYLATHTHLPTMCPRRAVDGYQTFRIRLDKENEKKLISGIHSGVCLMQLMYMT